MGAKEDLRIAEEAEVVLFVVVLANAGLDEILDVAVAPDFLPILNSWLQFCGS